MRHCLLRLKSLAQAILSNKAGGWRLQHVDMAVGGRIRMKLFTTLSLWQGIAVDFCLFRFVGSCTSAERNLRVSTTERLETCLRRWGYLLGRAFVALDSRIIYALNERSKIARTRPSLLSIRIADPCLVGGTFQDLLTHGECRCSHLVVALELEHICKKREDE